MNGDDRQRETYVVDTSSWGRIDGSDDPDAAWEIITRLAQQGRVKCPAQVIRELKKDTVLFRKIRAIEAGIRVTRSDVRFLRLVGEITFRHQGMSRPRSKKTRADPYVIALAEISAYTVVADETLDRRPNAKIPGVCARRRVPCINLSALLRIEAETQQDV